MLMEELFEHSFVTLIVANPRVLCSALKTESVSVLAISLNVPGNECAHVYVTCRWASGALRSEEKDLDTVTNMKR